MTKKLPNRLSSLLRMAVEDAKICEATPGYTLRMGHWHTPDYSEKTCYVCLAGAVMAVEQQMPWGENIENSLAIPSSEIERGKLRAIDHMRTGLMFGASECLLGTGSSLRLSKEETHVFFRTTDHIQKRLMTDLGRAHWHTYIEVASMLKAAGL